MIEGASAPKTGNISVPSVDLSSATSSGKKLVTSGDITDFVTVSSTKSTCTIIVPREFDIEYEIGSVNGSECVTRTTVSESRYVYDLDEESASIKLGYIYSTDVTNHSSDMWCYISAYSSGVSVTSTTSTLSVSHSSSLTFDGRTYDNCYRLYA